MEEEEDYFAPFGMSQFDFNSMIRRRNLANLTQQLVEQGRVTLPGGPAVPEGNTPAQLADVEDDAASTPEPLVDDDDEDVARRSSPCYSREIDEDSPRFATFFDGPCRRPVVSECHSPTNMAVLSRKSSIYASFSNSSPASTASRATSLDTHCSGTAAPEAGYCPPLPPQSAVKETSPTSVAEPQSLYISSFPATSWRSASVDTYCSGTAAPKAEYCPVKIDPWFYKTLRMSDNKSHSPPAAARVIDRVRESKPMPPQGKLREHARGPELEASEERDLDLLKSIVALLRKFARREELQEPQPPVDRIIELSRLRRAVRMLDFDFDDAIMLASDLTSLVPVPPSPGSQEMPETDDVGDIFETRKWFRSRLARTVRRRVESLRHELRVGDALKVEHWYKDVVDLVGWRDEHEARMSWSWLENDGFF